MSLIPEKVKTKTSTRASTTELEAYLDSIFLPATGNHTFQKEEDRNTISSSQNHFSSIKGMIAPGIEILYSEKGTTLFHKTYGKPSAADNDSALKKGMIYDLGSLTKIIACSTIFMKLIEQKLLDPDIRVSRVLQSFGSAGKETMKISQLLNNTSGYPRNLPLHRTIIKGPPTLNSLMTRRSALHLLYNEIYRTRLDNVPGKVYRPSDIGYLLLGQILEIVSGTPLSKLYTQLVARPFNLESTGFIDLEQIRRKTLMLTSDVVISSGHCSWRNKNICGEVMDETSWALGGIAPHHGLFGSSYDLHKYLDHVVKSYHGDSSLLSPEITKKFLGMTNSKNNTRLVENEIISNIEYPFGWEAFELNPKYRVCGGWSNTGSGMWIDPESKKILIILSNATQINHDTKKVKALALKALLHCFQEQDSSLDT
jgi:CubicO group peptidase (beta-lactamase class C family)